MVGQTEHRQHTLHLNYHTTTLITILATGALKPVSRGVSTPATASQGIGRVTTVLLQLQYYFPLLQQCRKGLPRLPHPPASWSPFAPWMLSQYATDVQGKSGQFSTRLLRLSLVSKSQPLRSASCKPYKKPDSLKISKPTPVKSLQPDRFRYRRDD